MMASGFRRAAAALAMGVVMAMPQAAVASLVLVADPPVSQSGNVIDVPADGTVVTLRLKSQGDFGPFPGGVSLLLNVIPSSGFDSAWIVSASSSVADPFGWNAYNPAGVVGIVDSGEFTAERSDMPNPVEVGGGAELLVLTLAFLPEASGSSLAFTGALEGWPDMLFDGASEAVALEGTVLNVVAVPEPSAIALMFAGVLLLGLGAVRRGRPVS